MLTKAVETAKKGVTMSNTEKQPEGRSSLAGLWVASEPATEGHTVCYLLAVEGDALLQNTPAVLVAVSEEHAQATDAAFRAHGLEPPRGWQWWAVEAIVQMQRPIGMWAGRWRFRLPDGREYEPC